MPQTIVIRPYNQVYLAETVDIWNTVIEDGIAFPQLEGLTMDTGHGFFLEQTYTGIAYNTKDQQVVGLYTLHPNNVGRCGHIGNASYAVKKGMRGQGIGEQLVRDSLKQAKRVGFTLMQFNAVVQSNKRALDLYRRLGFKEIGAIPDGFMMKDGTYETIVLFYYPL